MGESLPSWTSETSDPIGVESIDRCCAVRGVLYVSGRAWNRASRLLCLMELVLAQLALDLAWCSWER